MDIDLSDDSVTAYVGGKVAGGRSTLVPGAPDTPTVWHLPVYLQYDVQDDSQGNADGNKYVTEGVPW